MARGWSSTEEEALDWAVRSADPGFEAWDALAEWLERDPAHASLYQRICADVADMAKAVKTLPTAVPAPAIAQPARPRRWGFAGAAVAAALVGVVSVGVIQTRPQPYAIETPAGMTRHVTLADGSSIAINGASRLVLDRRDPRVATLDRGQALFTVRHDEASPFRVRVGEDELVDVGTQFDVVRDADGRLRFEVSEGAVVYNPDGENVRIDAGKALEIRSDDPVVRVTAVDRESVGAWSEGRLEYDGAPIGQVAADLSRTLGVPITAGPAVAARPFHGTIRLAGMAQDPRRLEPLLSVAMRRSGSGWEMVAPR